MKNLKNKKLIIFSVSIISIFTLAYIFVPKYYENYILENEVAKLPYEFVEEGQVLSIHNGTKKQTQIKTKIMETKEAFELDVKDYGRKFYNTHYIPSNYEFETGINMYYLSKKNFDVNEIPLETRNENSETVKIFKKVENYKHYSKTYMIINTLIDENIENSYSNPKIFLNNSLAYDEKDNPVINTILTNEDINSSSYKEMESDIFENAYYVERKDGMQVFVGINPLSENITYYDFANVDIEKVIIKEEYEKQYNKSYVMVSATKLSKDEFNKIIENVKEL